MRNISQVFVFSEAIEKVIILKGAKSEKHIQLLGYYIILLSIR